TSGDTTALLDNQLAVLVLDVERGDFTTQALPNQFQVQHFTLEVENVGVVELREDFFRAIAERAQQHGRRQLAATVDTHEDRVFRIELEVQPGATVGNDSCRV